MSVLHSHLVRHEARGSAPSSGRRVEAVPAVRRSFYARCKPWFDRIVALLLLAPGLPLTLLLVLLVRLTSRGPGIYRQVRMGQHGRKFTMYKIRTMRHDAEAQTGAVWTQTRDHRVTRVGCVLRRIHLDELPQLFNVLRGEMALIGPRPERPEFVHVLSAAVPHYADRLAVAPGITGLAQLNLPPDSDLNSVRRKLALDLEYIQTFGLWMDLRLLLCTIARVVKLPEPFLLWLFGLRRVVKLPAEAMNANGTHVATPAAVAHQAAMSGGVNGHQTNRKIRPRPGKAGQKPR